MGALVDCFGDDDEEVRRSDVGADGLKDPLGWLFRMKPVTTRRKTQTAPHTATTPRLFLYIVVAMRTSDGRPTPD